MQFFCLTCQIGSMSSFETGLSLSVCWKLCCERCENLFACNVKDCRVKHGNDIYFLDSPFNTLENPWSFYRTCQKVKSARMRDLVAWRTAMQFSNTLENPWRDFLGSYAAVEGREALPQSGNDR